MNRLRNVDPTARWVPGEDDPFFWCIACADDAHELHHPWYRDLFGERHVCCCPTCEA